MDSTVSNIFNLKDLFSIPLQAVIEANANAAETAIGFIKAYGFEQGETPSAGPEHWGKLKFVSFTYKYNEGGFLKTMTIKIPLLSLIPIPLLEVKNAVFDFGVKIIDYHSNTENSPGKRNNALTGNIVPRQINAMIVPINKSDAKVSKRQASLTANLDVHIEMVKADLPAGFLQLMNLGQQASQGEVTDKYTIQANIDYLIFREGAQLSQKLIINIKRDDGQPMVDEKIVTVEIKKNVDFNNDILEQPPRIDKGKMIGISTNTLARVLSTDNGLVELLLQAKGNGVKNNGFVKISSEGAKDLFIYYTNF